jgi:hypothetical protein
MNSVLHLESHCREFLVTHQNSDGGWGFHPGAPSAVEATAWTVMALHPTNQSPEFAGATSRAREWLLRAQLADGSWPAIPDHPPGCWVTSLASRALHLYGGAQDAVERGLHWVLNSWPAEGTLWWRLKHMIYRNREAKQDSSLRGWNWTPGTASWVEPTAHALLLLRALPANALPAGASKRRELAERMLFDRMCPGGGWNSGNPLVYGAAGIPRIGPTVWALLALREHAERPEVKQSVAMLETAYASIPGPASLALANWCLTSYRRRTAPLDSTLNELYSRNRFFDNMLTMAWVILAFNAEASAAVTAPGAAASE